MSPISRLESALVTIGPDGIIKKIVMGRDFKGITSPENLVGLAYWDVLPPSDSYKIHSIFFGLKPGGPTIKVGYSIIFGGKTSYRYATVWKAYNGFIYLIHRK